MKWTDLFIRKPVLSLVVSALVLVFGLKAIGSLPINQYPQTQNAVVTITTAYYGADPETIEGFITQPLEASLPFFYKREWRLNYCCNAQVELRFKCGLNANSDTN